jgi:FMN phosphatase YigB (HAD superfamily)
VSRAPRLVVFDLGGVLVRIARTWAEACAAAGLPVRGDAERAERILARRPYVFDYERGRIGRSTFLEGIAASTGGLYTPEEVGAIHAAWLLEEYPGIPRVLDLLEARGAGTAILSNTNEAHWAAMLPTGTPSARFPNLARIRHPFASHELGTRKPEPSAYAQVEARTGTPPGDILFFDDLPENVEAARARGWQARLVDPHGDPTALMLETLGGA